MSTSSRRRDVDQRTDSLSLFSLSVCSRSQTATGSSGGNVLVELKISPVSPSQSACTFLIPHSIELVAGCTIDSSARPGHISTL